MIDPSIRPLWWAISPNAAPNLMSLEARWPHYSNLGNWEGALNAHGWRGRVSAARGSGYCHRDL
jgi:hypothetical protein